MADPGVSSLMGQIFIYVYADHAKGQYHFVYILAPRKTRRFAAFVVGWMNLLAWSVTLCSGISVFVAAVSGMTSFSSIAFGATQSQQYFTYSFAAITSGEYYWN